MSGKIFSYYAGGKGGKRCKGGKIIRVVRVVTQRMGDTVIVGNDFFILRRW